MSALDSLETLPTNVLNLLIGHLSLHGALSLQCVSKFWRDYLDETFWASIIQKYNTGKVSASIWISHCMQQPKSVKLSAIDEWKAIESLYKGHVNLQSLPKCISLGVDDLYHTRLSIINVFANGPDNPMTENGDIDPTLDEYNIKKHVLWGQEIVLNCQEPPYGCETYYLGPDVWRKWWAGDGFVLAAPHNVESGRIRERYNLLTSDEVMDIGGQRHIRAEIRAKQTTSYVPVVLVGYNLTSQQKEVERPKEPLFTELYKLAEEWKIPYIEIYKYTKENCLQVHKLLILEIAKAGGWANLKKKETNNTSNKQSNNKHCNIS